MEKILSCLLRHANTGSKSTYFYTIKNKLLSEYGQEIGYDYQYLEGKECYSCNGTGTYHGFYGSNICYKCAGTGMYQDARLVRLKRILFHNYIFHQPDNSITISTKTIPPCTIRGYIVHEKTRYCSFSRFVLFLLYEKGYLKRWWKETGNGWRCYTFYSAENVIYNIVHLLKYRHNSIPLLRIIRKLKKKLPQPERTPINGDDLPF